MSGQTFLEGFLLKKGHLRHNWTVRWFKLSESSLRYYKDQKHNVPRGRIALMNATLTKSQSIGSSKTDDRTRECVFKVTTESGVEYAIRAFSESEYEIWTVAIQNIIDKMKKNHNTSETSSSIPEGCSNKNSNDSVDLCKHTKLFMKMGKPKEGVKLEERTIDGIRYTQGFSGAELQQWLWRHLGSTNEAAEQTVKRLLKTGLINCLTPDLKEGLFSKSQYYTMLSDGMPLRSRTSSHVRTADAKVGQVASSSKTGSNPKTKKISSRDGLPTDLPPGDVIKKGILFKRGHIVPSWKPRCFVLQKFPVSLSYFDPSKKNPKTINSLSLHGATVFSVCTIAAEVALQMKNPSDHLFCVKLASGTPYLMIASSDDEKEQWINTIKPMCRRKTIT